MRINLILFLLSLVISSSAQEPDPLAKIYNLEPRTADCLGAIPLIDKLGPVIGNNKIGANYEIKKQSEPNPYIFEWEHNVVWYKFEAEKTGMLHLLIAPVDPAENFDFILYEADGHWFCADFHEYVHNPISSNISETPGATGLADLGTETYVTKEGVNKFSKPIKVEKGKTYYLVVDSPAGPNSGHSIEKEIK